MSRFSRGVRKSVYDASYENLLADVEGTCQPFGIPVITRGNRRGGATVLVRREHNGDLGLFVYSGNVPMAECPSCQQADSAICRLVSSPPYRIAHHYSCALRASIE